MNKLELIQSKIYEILRQHVMWDRDWAEMLYWKLPDEIKSPEFFRRMSNIIQKSITRNCKARTKLPN